MIKKFKFTHFMPFALAVFVTIVIVIACGKGTLEDVKDLDNKKYVDDATKCLFEENSKSRCKLKDYDSLDSLVETPYSSSKSEKSSSSDENDDSSSSRNASGSSSSNNAQSSSSLVQSSSSVEYPYILSCKVKVGYDTGTVRKPIPKKNMPEVKCTEKKDSTKVTTLDPDADIYWTNNPRWSNPTDIKDYNDIRAKVDSDDNKKPCQGESVKCEGTFRICPEVGCPVLSSSSPAPSSSTAVVVSSSSVASAVSSSSRASSSSVAAVSSSSAAVSSSSSTTTTYTLACAAVPASGTAGTAINAPAVTCSGTAVNSGLTWTSTPTNINWSNPAANTYTSIKASASSGNCSGQTATCSGQLVVSPAPVTYTLACAAVPTSGTAGTAITPPAVTCSGTAVNSGLTWTSTPTNISWSNPTANTYTSIKASASSGNCSGQTATCSGQLVVSAPAVTYTLACTGLPATGKAGESITLPTVKCNGSNSTSTTVNAGLDWTGAPSWTNPTAAEYNVSVTTSEGNCSGKPAASCGKITITSANTCAYQAAWCGGSPTSASSVSINPPTDSEGTGNKCFFVSDVTKIQGKNIKVNGVTMTPNNDDNFVCGQWGKESCSTLLGDKKDGGYYIRSESSGWISENNSAYTKATSAPCR